MISGPTHPLNRDGLWHLVSERPELFERGLRIVHAGFDGLGSGLGTVDGLARDAAGAPCLVILVEAEDALLLARVVACHAFLARNAAALARAVPEAELDASGSFRVLLVGARLPADLGRDLERLQLSQVRACEVETFRVGGQERVLVRAVWPPPAQLPELDARVPAAVRTGWEALSALLVKFDVAVRLDGDRFSRRVFWHGRPLCDFWFADDRLLAQVPGGSARTIATREDVQTFGDQVMRRFVGMLSEREASSNQGGRPDLAAPEPRGGSMPVGAPLDALRSVVGASRLTREEYSALADLSAEEHVPEGN